MKVFLGGTTNNSDWRDKLIPGLKINYFNPMVDVLWADKHKDRELKQRELCDIVAYVITPKMDGVYSIAELIDDSNKQPYKTVFMYLLIDGNIEFTREQIYSLNMVGRMVEANGGTWVRGGLQQLAEYLNNLED